MSVGLAVTYDGLAFNSGVADGNGTQWYITDWAGWDSATPRVASADPTTRHGTVITRVLLGARALSLTGVVKSPDLASHWIAYYGIDKKFNNLITPKALVVSEDIDRYAGVCRTGDMRKTLMGGCAFQFQVNLTAPDPLKYAVTPVTTSVAAGATVSITNDGSFPTEKITVTAGGSGLVSVVNNTTGGRGIVTDRSVASGTVFDFLARTVVSGTASVFDALAPYSDWFTLQPGANSITNNGPASVSIVHYPAWL